MLYVDVYVCVCEREKFLASFSLIAVLEVAWEWNKAICGKMMVTFYKTKIADSWFI